MNTNKQCYEKETINFSKYANLGSDVSTKWRNNYEEV